MDRSFIFEEIIMKKEINYEFKKRLLKVHKESIRNYELVPENDETVLKNGCKIVLPKESNRQILTAARDFEDYLFTSMGISAGVYRAGEKDEENAVYLIIDEKADTDYRIEAGDAVRIYSKDTRGLARGLYRLEDKMSERRAPYIKKETIAQSVLFSPRMIHSGYGMDDYPNEYLAHVAHSGMDSILVYVGGINKKNDGHYLDFNELIYRAENYGLDVYAYSYLKCSVHPDDDGAQEVVDSIYGKLFEECPGFKGVVLVGESVEFRSKDPNTTQKLHTEKSSDGLPSVKPSPGWWPCVDYPQWLELVKKAVRKHREDADIVFWTYNWGDKPEEDRIKLINNMPTDITLLVTFEMFEKYRRYNSLGVVSDYTISFEGPGGYFISEAEAAKKRGIRLYAMTNTAGTTWDMGTVPYEPMPYQWIKRYKNILEAKERYGLCGLMESHHFGMWPSFISDLTKEAFLSDNTTMEESVSRILKKWYGEENVQKVDKALQLWSEAITYCTPTVEDQYGAFRIGPAYPFALMEFIKPQSFDYAAFGNDIVMDYWIIYMGRESLPMMRIEDEIKSLEKMSELLKEGTDILESIENKNEELGYLTNLGHYMTCVTVTGFNAKRWYRTVTRLKAESDREKCLGYVEELKGIAAEEKINCESAIEYVQNDSRLGWEPSMDYMGDEPRIRWKLKYLEHVVENEIPIFEKSSKI